MRIQIQNLTKIYRRGIKALQDVDLEIGTGMFGLLGPNGAGKTTLLRILATLIKPTSGRVVVDGLDVTDRRQKWAVRGMLGYAPQELSLYPNLTVVEFLDYIATLKLLHDRRARAAEIERLLTLARLERVARQRIKRLSGGMKRRVGIAQALIGDPRLLIVDEPTGGLDPEERVRFRTLLARFSSGRTVLLATHIVEDVATTCNDMAILHEGRVHFNGRPADLTGSAVGQTWELTLPVSRQPDPTWRVVTSVHNGQELRLRIVGPCPSADARPVSPTLEEAYLALMGLEGEAA